MEEENIVKTSRLERSNKSTKVRPIDGILQTDVKGRMVNKNKSKFDNKKNKNPNTIPEEYLNECDSISSDDESSEEGFYDNNRSKNQKKL